MSSLVLSGTVEKGEQRTYKVNIRCYNVLGHSVCPPFKLRTMTCFCFHKILGCDFFLKGSEVLYGSYTCTVLI